MNSLTKGIESVIKNAIEEYVQSISTKYEDIDIDDLEELWNEVSKTMKISVSTKSAKTPVNASKPSSKATSNDSDGDGCPYKFIKGAKQDQTCGSKAKEGNVYCSRHKKYEGTEQKERKASPIPKKGTIKPSKSKSRSPAKAVQRVLRKHKTLSKLWHPETGLYFRSDNERVVVGKIVDDKLVDLTEEDIDECRRWSFSFVPPNEAELEGDSSSDEDDEKKETSQKVSIYMVAASSSASGQKFWECKIDGVNYTTRHGKVGNDGTTKEKVFDTFLDAMKEFTKMVKTKTKKGYVDDNSASTLVEEEPKKVSKKKDKVKEEEPKKVSKKDKKVTPPPSPVSSVKSSKSSKKKDSEKFRDPSDIEDALNELQGASSDNSDVEEEEETKTLGKKFIPDALVLSKKATADDDEEEFEDDEEMLVEEYEEVEYDEVEE